MAFDLGNLLQQYPGGITGQGSADVSDHYEQVAQTASPEVLGHGLAAAFHSEQTPPFPEMVAHLFSQGTPQRRSHDMRFVYAMAAMMGLFASTYCFAAAPADAPAGTTGMCKDGTYYSGVEKKGACRGHKGVKDWYADATAAKPDAKAEAPKATTAPAPAPAPKAPAASASTSKAMPAPAATAVPGGGAGKVWVNTSTKVYHCEGDRWYGKTKSGEYMTEADAKTKGFKPDHGKSCQ